MPDTIKVGCRVSNGVKIRVSDWFDSPEEPGKRVLREVGAIDLPGPVSAHGEKPGPAPAETVTEVDAKLFETWMRTSGESDLVTTGSIYQVKDPEPAPVEPEIKATPVAAKPADAKK